MSTVSFKNVKNTFFETYIWYICIEDLELNNLQWLIYDKTKPLSVDQMDLLEILFKII